MDGSGLTTDLQTAELLLAESNHRIANNLTLIGGLLRMQASQVAARSENVSASEAARLLTEAAARIDTVARLHRLLSEAGSADAVDLGAYLRTVAEMAVSAAAGEGEVQLACKLVSDVRMTPERALAAAFAVGELITNAAKHAGSGPRPLVVGVRLHRSGAGTVALEVSDTGPGLPDSFDPSKDGGLGMRLLRALAKRLDAKLIFAGSRPGLAVQYLIPVAPTDQ